MLSCTDSIQGKTLLKLLLVFLSIAFHCLCRRNAIWKHHSLCSFPIHQQYLLHVKGIQRSRSSLVKTYHTGHSSQQPHSKSILNCKYDNNIESTMFYFKIVIMTYFLQQQGFQNMAIQNKGRNIALSFPLVPSGEYSNMKCLLPSSTA